MNELLTVKGLSKQYFAKNRVTTALQNINLSIREGEILALVGESGSGKSTFGKILLGLEQPTGGEVFFNGIEISGTEHLRQLRRQMQIVFQNPYSSLNPVKKVEDIIGEGLAIHGLAKGSERRDRVREMMVQTGLPLELMQRYAKECSGGQRQRIAIARALIIKPKFLVLDEPITSLDILIQAQIVNLLLDLQKKFGLTYLFITHDLSMVKYLADRVAVLKSGHLVELSDVRDLFETPRHSHTKSLISSILRPLII